MIPTLLKTTPSQEDMPKGWPAIRTYLADLRVRLRRLEKAALFENQTAAEAEVDAALSALEEVSLQLAQLQNWSPLQDSGPVVSEIPGVPESA